MTGCTTAAAGLAAGNPGTEAEQALDTGVMPKALATCA
jgi:hypothetical protein